MATKAKKKPASSAVDRYASQVGAESKLKFGPEEDSLAQALKDAESTFEGDQSIARGTRRAIEHAAKSAKPRFAADNATAREAVTATKTTLAADLAKLPTAGAMAGASARDAAGTERRLSELLAGANAETEARQRDAAAGEGYALQNARSRFGESREKIATRQQGIAGEKGAFAQARAGELVEDARDRRVTVRGQDKTADTAAANRRTSNRNTDAALEETTRHNREMEQNAAADKKKSKVASPKETAETKTKITRAVEQAKALQKEGRDRSTSAKFIVNGRAGQTIKQAPKDMKMPDGTEYKAGDTLEERHIAKVPEVKATDEYIASVALDLAYDGHLSTRNMKLLQKMGLSVKDLGLNTSGRSGTRAAKKPARMVPRPTRPTRGKPSPLTGVRLGGFPDRG